MSVGTDLTKQIRERMVEREFCELSPDMWESRDKTMAAVLEGLLTREVDDNIRMALVMLLVKLYAETLSAELEVARQQIESDTGPDAGTGE